MGDLSSTAASVSGQSAKPSIGARVDTARSAAPGGHHARVLLREAAVLRGRSDERAIERRRRILAELIAQELPAVVQQVRIYGVARSGRPWVDEADVDDVVSEACIRAIRMFESFEGVEPGQLRAALSTCVHFACLDYVRQDAAKKSVIDGDPGGVSSDGDDFDALSRIASSASAGDRAEFKETLLAITTLDPRAADVVTLRLSGHSSAEVAKIMGMSVSNVDQVFSRSVRKMRSFTEGDGDG